MNSDWEIIKYQDQNNVESDKKIDEKVDEVDRKIDEKVDNKVDEENKTIRKYVKNSKDYNKIMTDFLYLLPKENKLFCIQVLQMNDFDIHESIAWLVVDNRKIQRLRRKLRKKFNDLDKKKLRKKIIK